MRILQVTDCYPPPLVGGRDLLVRMLSRELADRGHEVEVVSLAGSAGPRTEMDGPVMVHRLAGWSRALGRVYANPDKPFHPTLPDPGLARAVHGLIAKRRPQVVHAHSWLLFSLLPVLPSPGTRLVVWLHDAGFVCAKTTFVHRGRECSGPMYGKCVRCASGQYGLPKALALTTGLAAMRPWRGKVDRYVANSRSTARSSAALVGRSGPPMEVIPPFVPDDALLGGARKRPAFVPPHGDYLMFAGALGPHKGIDHLLSAWGDLPEPRIPLVLAGIRRFDTPSAFPAGVILAEEVAHRDVLAAWANSLAAVVPSVWPEPFGLVALEAMAAGRAVIASAVGGLPELVEDGVTGILVPPGNVPALRGAMLQLLQDPSLRLAMGVAGRERARSNTASVVVSAWERVFRDVVEAGEGER